MPGAAARVAGVSARRHLAGPGGWLEGEEVGWRVGAVCVCVCACMCVCMFIGCVRTGRGAGVEARGRTDGACRLLRMVDGG